MTADAPGDDALSDADLLEGIAREDRAAFAELFRRYAVRVKAFMIRGGAADADADEIAQEVMAAIWRRAASFDPARASPATWIFAIARNRRIDMLRRQRRPVPDPEDPLFQPEPEPAAFDAVSVAEREARLRAALAGLGAEQRAVLIAAFYEGLSHAEIAERLGLPLGTVKSRLRLAFGHLRGALGKDLNDDFSGD
jgi:RNA polymerase sigma-70 factor, ECF subfamily